MIKEIPFETNNPNPISETWAQRVRPHTGKSGTEYNHGDQVHRGSSIVYDANRKIVGNTDNDLVKYAEHTDNGDGEGFKDDVPVKLVWLTDRERRRAEEEDEDSWG